MSRAAARTQAPPTEAAREDGAPAERAHDGRRARRAARLAVAGALAGVALAVVAVVRMPEGALPAGAVAQVNDVALARDDFLRSLDALARDRRNPVGDSERRFVLERMIDEELLVQRGLELGLARHDRKVRGDLVSAMLAAVSAEAEAATPSDDELRRFYEAHREPFAEGTRLRVQQVFVAVPPDADAEALRGRAERAAAAWRAGEASAAVRTVYGDPEPLPLPDTLLPPEKLQDYLGPTAMRTALALPAGGVSDPVRSGSGWHVLSVAERRPGSIPPLEAIRAQIEAEWRRRAGEEAVREYLAELRERARLTVAAELP